MKDALTLANINLFAILRNLEDLCAMDPVAKDLIKDKKLMIQFSVHKGPSAVLKIENGTCSLAKGVSPSDIKLYFPTPDHLNGLFDGTKNPIPLKGFTKIGFLTKEFTELTKRLEYFLKPTEELLKDPEYFRINTILTVYTAAYALEQIGNYDLKGKLNAARIPDGVIELAVGEGEPCVQLEVNKGVIRADKSRKKQARAYMLFSTMESANAVLNGKLDSFSAIGSGQFVAKGYLPMLDALNKILYQVPSYVG